MCLDTGVPSEMCTDVSGKISTCFREIQENTVLLREKVISLEKKLERSDKMKAGSANWQVLYKASTELLSVLLFTLY